MPTLRINNKTARALWLTAQGLADAPTGPFDLLQTIKDLGFVQLDTIQVVARAHHHILWSRNQNYREPMLDKLLADRGHIFEHYTHDASVIPMEFLPMWERQFRRKKAQMDKPGFYRKPLVPDDLVALMDRIRTEGPLSTHAFDTKTEGPKEMWSRPPHKLGLDYLWYTGELATSHRKNFNKFYDIAETVFPPDWRDTALSDDAQMDWLCHNALTRMGFGVAGDIQRYWEAMTAVEVRDWITKTKLMEVEVETATGDWFTAFAPLDIEARIAALTPPTSRLRILNPFDPVIRDRNRLSRLFGFEYRVEMFVPAAKRIWGYYVFPMLEGDKIVGRLEAKADRKASTLTVSNLWVEDGVMWTGARQKKLDQELERMRRFAGVDQTVVAL